MTKPENPPSFPVVTSAGTLHLGLSIRDYFATKALEGYISNQYEMSAAAGYSEQEKISLYGFIAGQSYKFADAMLKARGE